MRHPFIKPTLLVFPISIGRTIIHLVIQGMNLFPLLSSIFCTASQHQMLLLYLQSTSVLFSPSLALVQAVTLCSYDHYKNIFYLSLFSFTVLIESMPM